MAFSPTPARPQMAESDTGKDFWQFLTSSLSGVCGCIGPERMDMAVPGREGGPPPEAPHGMAVRDILASTEDSFGHPHDGKQTPAWKVPALPDLRSPRDLSSANDARLAHFQNRRKQEGLMQKMAEMQESIRVLKAGLDLAKTRNEGPEVTTKMLQNIRSTALAISKTKGHIAELSGKMDAHNKTGVGHLGVPRTSSPEVSPEHSPRTQAPGRLLHSTSERTASSSVGVPPSCAVTRAQSAATK